LSDEKHDNLIKTYNQLWLLVIDEISLMHNKLLTFIDHRLQVIKQTQSIYWQSWFYNDIWFLLIFSNLWFMDFKILKHIKFNLLRTKFWHENVMNYKKWWNKIIFNSLAFWIGFKLLHIKMRT
jgi:hypothetical protein